MFYSQWKVILDCFLSLTAETHLKGAVGICIIFNLCLCDLWSDVSATWSKFEFFFFDLVFKNQVDFV